MFGISKIEAIELRIINLESQLERFEKQHKCQSGVHKWKYYSSTGYYSNGGGHEGVFCEFCSEEKKGLNK